MSQDVTYQNDKLNLIYLPDGQVVNETGQDPAIPRVTGYQRFQIAADLGQANDYSAVVVIKDQALPIVDAAGALGIGLGLGAACAFAFGLGRGH